MPDLTRRQLLAAGVGAVGAVAAGGVLGDQLWPLLGREDLAPGRVGELVLPPSALRTSPDRLVFAAVGDTGSGGRQAFAVAQRMAQGYQRTPYGLGRVSVVI